MKVDVPNTKSQSDDEILSRMEDVTRNIFEDTTKSERWLIKTNNCVFTCNLYSLMGVKQLDCSTVIDGYTYQFLIRGTDVEQMKLVANDIAHSTIISVPLGGTLHLELANVDVQIPERWELASHEVVEEEGVKQESAYFYAHDEDGTSTVASLTFTDILSSTGPLSFGNRSIYDNLYTKSVFTECMPIASAHTKNVIQTKISGYDFAIMPHNEIEDATWVFGVGYGYSVNLLYMSRGENVLNDSRFIQLQELTAQVFEKAKNS